MGRYITGDLDYKFWFGVQSSDAADRFGVTGVEPNYLHYYFDENNLPDVQEELKNIESSLGDDLKKMIDFFENSNGYNDQTLKENNIDESKISEYADYRLGKEIEKCIVDFGTCEFEAEL